MSHSEPDAFPPLPISTLCISLNSQTRREIESISVKAGDVVLAQICQAISPGNGHRESFHPPLEVSLDTKMLISMRCRKTFQVGSVIKISLDPKKVLREASEQDEMRLYRKTEKNVDIEIGLQSLPSTVGKVIASCDRFRVLIIGESGVGKSSLINKVFGVAGVDVSDNTRGRATIDREYIAPDNGRFVVHDSCGFEPADQQNLTAVCDFIAARRRMQDIKDQIHAVWLCLSIPFAGGRLLEAGVEDFLKNRDQILGNIPLVVVFTKFDLLVNMVETDAIEDSEGCHEAALRERTQASLDGLCLKPIRAAAGSQSVSHAAVSTIEGYEDTLAALIDETTKNIQIYVKDEAAHYIATIAQRVNMSLKVASTIAVGEKRYWKALMASPNFRGRTMKECLDVIHKDIVTVWNFNDPDNTLLKKDFKAGLLEMPNIRVREKRDLPDTMKTGVTMIAALVTIVAGIAGTGGAAIPIVVPVAGLLILGKLARDLYRASQDVVRQLMAYIVDLTCVMQIIFLLASTRRGIVNIEIVGMAMEAHQQVHRDKLHAEINSFGVNLAVVPGKRDDVLEKIKELIRAHRIGDEELSKLRQQLLSL